MKEQLIKCKVCGAEMAANSKACPSCGAKNKKPIYKRVWFWILIVIVVIVIIAAIGGSGSDSKKSSNGTTAGAQTTTATKTTYAIGETAQLDGASVVVNKIEKSSGDTYYKPKSGYEFVIVEVTITNTGNSNITYNPYDFQMQNSQGNITDTTLYTTDRDSDLSTGELAPGGTITGTLPFEEPINDSALTLIYEGNMWSASQIKFSMQ